MVGYLFVFHFITFCSDGGVYICFSFYYILLWRRGIISQLKRYSRACDQYSDFLERAQLLTQKLLKQGYVAPRLKLSLQIFYCRHRYEISISQMTIGQQFLCQQLSSLQKITVLVTSSRITFEFWNVNSVRWWCWNIATDEREVDYRKSMNYSSFLMFNISVYPRTSMIYTQFS
jgi:hypothetical protein